MLRKSTGVAAQGGLFGEEKGFDLEAHYKKEILKAPGSFEATEALAKLYANSGKSQELNELIHSLISARQFKSSLDGFADFACKIGILYQHHPNEASLQYINTWCWFGTAIASYRENALTDTKNACGEACFRMAKLIQENKGFKFNGLEHLVKQRLELAFEAGVVRAAYELGDFHLKNYFEGDTSEAVAWFEKGKVAGDERCVAGLEAAAKVKAEVEAQVAEERNPPLPTLSSKQKAHGGEG